MNWEMIAALAAIGAFLTAVIAAIFTHGQLTERVKSHNDRLDDVETTVEGHGARLTKAEIDIARAEEWRKGYNAGAAKLS